MKQCKLIIRDAVNVRFEGLDLSVRKKMVETLKFVIPEARHMEKFKLGRWDGTISFCSLAGNTYFNLLDRLLPILEDQQITLEIEDRRPPIDYVMSNISETMFADKLWGPQHALAGQPIVLRDYQVQAIQSFVDNFQSVQTLATGMGKCLEYNTEIEIEIDQLSEFAQYLLNTVEYQEISTGAGTTTVD